MKELLFVITFPAFSACRFIEASCSKRLLIRIDIQLSGIPRRLEMRYVVERLEKERRRREAGNTLRRLNNSGAPPPSGAGWRVGFPISTLHYKAGLAPCAPLPKPYPIKPHSQSSSSDVWMTLFST
jgi:hypothetical protein